MPSPGTFWPRYAARPVGTTEAPAYFDYGAAEMPPAREDARLLTRVDWAWVKRAIDSGRAVGIAVDPQDNAALIDGLQNRLGHDLVVRIAEDNAVWVCRPEAIQDTAI